MREVKERWDVLLRERKPEDVQGSRDELNRILDALKQNKSDEDPEGEVATELAQSVLQAIAPMRSSWLFGKRERAGHDEEQNAVDGNVDRQFQELAATALQIVSQLRNHKPKTVSCWPDEDTLLTVAALAARDNPWVSEIGTRIAKDILKRELGQFGEDDSASTWVADIVLPYLRRTFSRSKPAGVTATGRPAAYGDDSDADRGLPDESAETKPWKYADYRAISILYWILQNANEPFMRTHSRTLVPPLLTVGEDASTAIRSHGIRLIHLWISTTPTDISRSSGLLRVFEENVLVPSLGYLPSLTPEQESIRLVRPSLEALLTMCEKAGDRGSEEWSRVADKIVRQGILGPYHHVAGGGRYPRLIQVLVEQLQKAVGKYLGMYSVKYLKDLVPMLSDVIRDVTEPLARDQALLFAALVTLDAMVTVCRVRIVVNESYVDEIVKMMCLAWLHVQEEEEEDGEGTRGDDDGKGREKIRTLLQGTARDLFLHAGKRGIDLHPRVEKLIEMEPKLKELFPPPQGVGSSS